MIRIEVTSERTMMKRKEEDESAKGEAGAEKSQWERAIRFRWRIVQMMHAGRLRGGPGLTMETAWELLGVGEETVALEYKVMRTLRLPRRSRQRMLTENDRHYDVHDIRVEEKRMRYSSGSILHGIGKICLQRPGMRANEGRRERKNKHHFGPGKSRRRLTGFFRGA